MRTDDFLDIALAGVESGRVEVESLEPAEVSPRVVGALSQIVSELAGNASAFSGPSQSVRLSGAFTDDHYVLTVSDNGVGIPQPMIEALNQVLASPPSTGSDGLSLGMAVVARLAARHDIDVELSSGAPGTKASIRVPADLITRMERAPLAEPASVAASDPDVLLEELKEAEAAARYQQSATAAPVHVVTMSDSGRAEAEKFLERVFGSLASSQEKQQRPPQRPGEDAERSVDPGAGNRVALRSHRSDLEVRVPGANFRVVDDERSVASSEAAIDIRSALDRFQSGRSGSEDTTRRD